MQFSLWDAQGSGSPPSGGTQVGGTHTIPGVTVSNGLFTVLVNSAGQFGASAFKGQSRWLQVAVQCGSDPGYTTLSRQAITAAPYASYATGNWGLSGNAGTNAGNFLATTDNMSLTLRVSNTVALRLEPNAITPNVVGGAIGNTVFAGKYGAFIGGGLGNNISGNYNTIGGGYQNTNTSNYATIGGGTGNTASGYASTVGGGDDNTASGDYSTVGGGSQNKAQGASSTVSGGGANNASGDNATVGGGVYNTASGYGSMVPGCNGNSTAGAYSFAAGRNAHALHDGAFVWADTASLTAVPITSTAPDQFIVRASGGVTMYSNASATVGVALAAIQGLYQMVQQQDARIEALEARVRALERQHTGNATTK